MDTFEKNRGAEQSTQQIIRAVGYASVVNDSDEDTLFDDIQFAEDFEQPDINSDTEEDETESTESLNEISDSNEKVIAKASHPATEYQQSKLNAREIYSFDEDIQREYPRYASPRSSVDATRKLV